MPNPDNITNDQLESNKQMQRRHTVADKLCRLLKILAEILEHLQLGALCDLAAWTSSVLGDLSRLSCNLYHKNKAASASILRFTLGSFQAVLFRVTKSILSASRLVLHAVQAFGSIAAATSSVIGLAIPVLNILSALGNFINDTIKFCRKKVKNLTEISFYSGKLSFTAVTIVGVIAALLMGPAAPVGIALLITGVIGYTTCSVGKAVIDCAKSSTLSLFQPRIEKETSEELQSLI